MVEKEDYDVDLLMGNIIKPYRTVEEDDQTRVWVPNGGNKAPKHNTNNDKVVNTSVVGGF